MEFHSLLSRYKHSDELLVGCNTVRLLRVVQVHPQAQTHFVQSFLDLVDHSRSEFGVDQLFFCDLNKRSYSMNSRMLDLSRTHLINILGADICETEVAQGVSADQHGRPLGTDRRTVEVVGAGLTSDSPGR